MNQDTYTIRSLAAAWKVPISTIRGELRRGELHGTKVAGRWVFSQAQLEDYLARHTQPATKPFTPEEVQRNRQHFEHARRRKQRQ